MAVECRRTALLQNGPVESALQPQVEAIDQKVQKVRKELIIEDYCSKPQPTCPESSWIGKTDRKGWVSIENTDVSLVQLYELLLQHLPESQAKKYILPEAGTDFYPLAIRKQLQEATRFTKKVWDLDFSRTPFRTIPPELFELKLKSVTFSQEQGIDFHEEIDALLTRFPTLIIKIGTECMKETNSKSRHSVQLREPVEPERSGLSRYIHIFFDLVSGKKSS